jgi:hypothetical protein
LQVAIFKFTNVQLFQFIADLDAVKLSSQKRWLPVTGVISGIILHVLDLMSLLLETGFVNIVFRIELSYL